jgi:V-type H+-transporting ATPase subunit d
MKFLEESIENLHENRTLNDIQNLFKEMKPEYIRTSLKRLWLEDFFEFCETEVFHIIFMRVKRNIKRTND